MDYIENYYVEVSSNEIGTDAVTVVVGCANPNEDEMVKDLKDRFRAKLRVAPDIRFDQPDEVRKITMPETQGQQGSIVPG